MINEDKILGILSEMQADIHSMKSEIADLKKNQELLFDRFSSMAHDISGLQTDYAELRNDLHSKIEDKTDELAAEIADIRQIQLMQARIINTHSADAEAHVFALPL